MSYCTCPHHKNQNNNECFTDITFEKNGDYSIELNYHVIDENDKCTRCGIFVHGMLEMVENLNPKSLKYSASKSEQNKKSEWDVSGHGIAWTGNDFFKAKETDMEKEGQLGEECDCAKMSCKDTCLKNHTHKTFSCRVCDPLVATNIEEKKDWEKELEETLVRWVTSSPGEPELIEVMKNFIREKLKEEREKWRLKNAGLYRQLFGEMNDEKTFTAKELWKMFNDYSPLFTE